MDHNLPIFKFVTDNKDEFHEVRQFLSGNRFQVCMNIKSKKVYKKYNLFRFKALNLN